MGSPDAASRRPTPARVRVLRFLSALLGLGILGLALLLLHHELSNYHLDAVRRALAQVPGRRIVHALLLTAASYGLLTVYDVLALRHVRHSLPYGRTAATSFVSYISSHNLGLSGLGGVAVRYRLYSAWGLSAAETAEVIAFCGLTFWLGFVTLGGVTFVATPLVLPEAVHALFETTRPLGVLFLALSAAYLVWSLLLRTPVRVRSWSFDPPRPRLVLLQVPLACVEWAVSAGVLFVLLPHTEDTAYEHVFCAFLLAQALGMISHVPAGLGVFDSTILVLLGRDGSVPEIVASLLLYRVVYYLVPLITGAFLLLGLELRIHRDALRGLRHWAAPLVASVVPRALALSTFLGGAVLLWTGSQPARGEGLAWLRDFVPLPVVEISHFAGSVIGAALLILARGLQRRLHAAWWVAAVLLGTGTVLSLTRGLDWAEATACLVAFLLLLPARAAFHRRASLLSDALRVEWVLSIALVLAGTIWLGLLAYRHVDYAHELWWRFSWEGDAPRYLRASAGASALVALVGLARLFRPADVRPAPPTAAELESVRAVLATTPETMGHLALVGDKALLFHPDRSAFLMYGVAGSTWVALGDPVGGTDEARRALVWRFREAAERAGDRPAFYEVAEDRLGLYAEAGFGLLKLGEEARVPLEGFGLEGGARKGLRASVHQVERTGAAFEILPAEAVPAALPGLRAVSDAWLTAKSTREKRFSLGHFDPDYLSLAPVAVVRIGPRVVAFANLWLGQVGGELSVDLMRHADDAPDGIMDYLFVRLMEWGRDAGYRWFSLGMAPLTGLSRSSSAPLWNHLASMAFRHGEHFYNFQGLRAYKEKFRPVWRSRYLAVPGSLALPAVVRDVASLISGGIGGAFRR